MPGYLNEQESKAITKVCQKAYRPSKVLRSGLMLLGLFSHFPDGDTPASFARVKVGDLISNDIDLEIDIAFVNTSIALAGNILFDTLLFIIILFINCCLHCIYEKKRNFLGEMINDLDEMITQQPTQEQVIQYLQNKGKKLPAAQIVADLVQAKFAITTSDVINNPLLTHHV